MAAGRTGADESNFVLEIAMRNGRQAASRGQAQKDEALLPLGMIRVRDRQRERVASTRPRLAIIPVHHCTSSRDARITLPSKCRNPGRPSLRHRLTNPASPASFSPAASAPHDADCARKATYPARLTIDFRAVAAVHGHCTVPAKIAPSRISTSTPRDHDLASPPQTPACISPRSPAFCYRRFHPRRSVVLAGTPREVAGVPGAARRRCGG